MNYAAFADLMAFLDLSTRAFNILHEEGIRSVAEAREWASQANEEHLRAVPGLGPVTLQEIREAVGVG